MTRPLAGVAGLAILLAWGACPGSRHAGPPSSTPPLPPLDAPEVMERAMAHVASRQRVDAVVEVRGLPGLGRLGVTLDVFAERPARLYVAARGPLGPPTDELWTDGGRYLWRSQRPGGGRSGPVTPETLGALLPAPLPPSQWVGTLLGLPLPEGSPEEVLPCHDGHPLGSRPGAWCVRALFGDGSDVHLAVAGTGAVVEAVTRQPGAAGAWSLRYAEPVPWLDGLATTIHVHGQGGPGPGAPSLTVRLKDVRLNGSPPPATLFAPLSSAP
jgi:hypothetical protein